MSEKEEEFLLRHDYTREEIIDGMKQLAARAGYESILDTLDI